MPKIQVNSSGATIVSSGGALLVSSDDACCCNPPPVCVDCPTSCSTCQSAYTLTASGIGADAGYPLECCAGGNGAFTMTQVTGTGCCIWYSNYWSCGSDGDITVAFWIIYCLVDVWVANIVVDPLGPADYLAYVTGDLPYSCASGTVPGFTGYELVVYFELVVGPGCCPTGTYFFADSGGCPTESPSMVVS